MEKREIAERIREFLETEFPNPGARLTDTTLLLEEWFVDSMAIVETVLFLEKCFGVRIDRRDINGERFRTVAALAELVSERQDT